MVGQPENGQETPSFQGLCVQDDTFLFEIIQASCRLFHANHRWPDYPRTVDEDIHRAVQLAYRVNLAPPTGKVRWFFVPCSDPARIAWEGTSEPRIAGAFAGSDSGLEERGLVGRLAFFQVFFGGYLTHAGDFILAETYFQHLIEQGLQAEGFLGLADIRHTLANWREELREFEDRNVCPREALVPASCAADPLSKLDVFDFDQAIALYELSVQAAPDVSFYRLHLARARIDAGDLVGARAELQTAALAAHPNPYVDTYLNLVDRLIERPSESTGDFLPNAELRERYHGLTAARLVDADTVAAITGEAPVILCEPTKLTGGYVAVIDGQAIQMPLDLDYPATKGLNLPVARDLGIGLKLAMEQLVIFEGPHVGLRRLKMFARPVLMTGDDHALIGLPRENEVVRSDRPLTPLPGASFNYYHWLIDSMGAATLAERKLGADALDFIVNRPLHGWQREVLELVSPDLRVHVLPGPTEHRILVDAFHLPPPARLHVPHPEAVRLLRERLSRHGKPRKGKRVWVGRTGARGRMTVNETAVQDYLARQGFEVFDPTGKSVAEQIAYFSDVEVFVALGGAALTNLLFCPDETRAVILSTAFHYHETWTALAGAIGQRCWVCLAGSETRPNPYMIWAVFDQEVRLEDVAVAIDQAVRA